MDRDASLLIVYDYGSLSPVRIAEAAESNGCRPIFAAVDTEHAREMLPVLAMLGGAVDTAPLTEAELVRTLARLRPAGIVTFSESRIPLTARLARTLDLPYHDPHSLAPIINKEAQRRRFAEDGIDGVRFDEIPDLAHVEPAIARVGLPAVIKPTVGASSRNTTMVHTRAECLRVVHDAFRAGESSLLLEEPLVGRPVAHPWGDYVAVDCVVTGDEIRPVFVTSKFALAAPFRERGGYGQASVLSEPVLREAQELACRAIHAVGVRNGIADVELKLTDDGPRVIEVNGRLGGWVDDLATRSGTSDPADLAVKAALGRPVEAPTLRADGEIAFHYLVVPPPAARRVRAVRDDLYRLKDTSDQVEGVRIMKRPGANVDWRIGADSVVAAVTGIADKHDGLADLVDEIESIDWIDYD